MGGLYLVGDGLGGDGGLGGVAAGLLGGGVGLLRVGDVGFGGGQCGLGGLLRRLRLRQLGGRSGHGCLRGFLLGLFLRQFCFRSIGEIAFARGGLGGGLFLFGLLVGVAGDFLGIVFGCLGRGVSGGECLLRGGGGCLGGGQRLICVGLGRGGIGNDLLRGGQLGLGRFLLLGNGVIRLFLGGSRGRLLGGGVLFLGGEVGDGLGCIGLGLGGCGFGGLGGGIGVCKRFHLRVVIGLELVELVLVGFLFRIGGIENLLLLGDWHGFSLFLGFIGFLETVIGLFLLVGLGLEIIGVVGDLALGESKFALFLGLIELEVALAAQLGDLLAVGGIPNLGGVVLASGGKLGGVRAD